MMWQHIRLRKRKEINWVALLSKQGKGLGVGNASGGANVDRFHLCFSALNGPDSRVS